MSPASKGAELPALRRLRGRKGVERGTRAQPLLFDVGEGIGLSWGRIPAGASDYALHRYPLNDNAGDAQMAEFGFRRDARRLILGPSTADGITTKRLVTLGTSVEQHLARAIASGVRNTKS